MDKATLHRKTLIPDSVPDWRALLNEGRAAGESVSRRITNANKTNGVTSQCEWADRCIDTRQLRTQMNIGLATWSMTESALEHVFNTFQQQTLRPPDAYQLILERRMGLPVEMRADAPQETGPVLWTDNDWSALGATTAIQPQAPLVGTPASFENVLKGLSAGLDTMGNFANFVLRYPYFDDDLAQVVSVLKALGAIQAQAANGAVVDSYLEDGHCGVFGDYRSVVGWALIERHIVETLCGVPFALAFGGLTGDPFKRAAVFRALELCTSPETLRYGYVHGSTITQTESLKHNLTAFLHDATTSLAAIHHFGWGSAYLAVPLTERERVPTVEETMEVHRLAPHCESFAKDLAGRIDWSDVETEADALADSGTRWCHRVGDFLQEIGIDIDNPLELMLAARQISPDVFERVGLQGEHSAQQPTELMQITRRETRSIIEALPTTGSRCDQVRVVVASTDVHWPAKRVIEEVLADRGAIVIDGGLAVDPERLVEQAITENGAAIVITTHNGWALNFGERLMKECERTNTLDLRVIMGGVLNEDAGPGANSEIPRDVSAELNALGIITTNDFSVLVESLAAPVRSSEIHH